MYCMSCGTKLPDNARFCSSCGAQVNHANAGLQDFARSTDNTMPQGEVEKVMSELWEKLAVYRKIAHGDSNRPVTREIVDEAERIFQTFEELPPNNIVANTVKHDLLPYLIAKKTEYLLRLRWFSEDAPAREKKRVIQNDWYLFLKDGMKGLFKAYTNLDEATVNLFLYELGGLGDWLENETVENMLLAIRLEKVDVTRDSVAGVAMRLGNSRFGEITKKVNSVMSVVKD